MPKDIFSLELIQYRLAEIQAMNTINMNPAVRDHMDWRMEVIKELRYHMGELLDRLEHADNCPARERMPEHIMRSGVQIGGSGRSSAAASWEYDHKCSCGLSESARIHESLEPFDQ